MRRLLTKMYIVYVLTSLFVTTATGFSWFLLDYIGKKHVVTLIRCTYTTLSSFLILLTLIKMINYYYIEEKTSCIKYYLFLIPLSLLLTLVSNKRLFLLISVMIFLPYYIMERDIDGLPLILIPFLPQKAMAVLLSLMPLIIFLETFEIARNKKGKLIFFLFSTILFILLYFDLMIFAGILLAGLVLYILYYIFSKPFTFRMKLFFFSTLFFILTIASSFYSEKYESCVFHTCFTASLGFYFLIFAIRIARKGWIIIKTYRPYVIMIIAGYIFLLLHFLSIFFEPLLTPTFLAMVIIGFSYVIMCFNLIRWAA